MPHQKKSTGEKNLRDRAEDLLAEKPKNPVPQDPLDSKTLIHELQVHQVELEMQNEELRAAQEKLEVSRSNYAYLYDFAPVGYLTLNEVGLISELNLTAATLLGFERNYLIGKRFASFLSPGHDDVFRRHLLETLRTGQRQSYELPLKRKGGTIVFAQLETVPVQTDGVRAFHTVLVDVTERIKQNVALTDARQSLTIEIEARHSAEEELLQARKMEAVGTLAGGIAHDFNNILAGIIGFTEMALDDDLPPDNPARHHLELVLQAGLRGRDLIKELLAFSRKSDHERMPVSFSEVLRETARMLRAAIPSTIEISVNIKATSDTIYANTAEIKQVIMNLVTNAAHAMGDAGTLSMTLTNAQIKKGSSSGLSPGPYLKLTVKDTGKGMTPDVMKRAFDPFFTTKERGRGTGMGLAVVYGIVDGLNGRVTVESAPGRGSTFSIVLPCMKSESTLQVAQDQSLTHGNEKILFIDDEELIAELGKGVLEKLGYIVTAMTDSRKALSLFLENPSRFDLVITDQTMPALTGLRLSEQLLKVRPDIPIILCTGHSDSINPESLKAAGVRVGLMKPLTRQELAEAVRRVLGKQDLEGRQK